MAQQLQQQEPGGLASQQRLEAIFVDVRGALIEVIRRHRVTWEEYRAATSWLEQAGSQAHEIPLLLDVFLSPAVDDINAPGNGSTESNVEGPFYIPGAAVLEPPYALPQRTDEPGDVLFFSGTVKAADGSALARAQLDVWQSDSEGRYSYIHPDVPPGNLRGRLLTDAQGAFELRTVIPAPYEIPTGGATGQLVAALGRTAFRPAHIHVKVSREGFRPLTTQIYFEGDPWLDTDIVDAAKPALITRLEWHQDDEWSRRLGRPYCSSSYDFVLSSQLG
jgi:catechol 1,2-dioxygenase